MICPSCLKENADDSRFCANCGAEIASAALAGMTDDGADAAEPAGSQIPPPPPPIAPPPPATPPPMAAAPPLPAPPPPDGPAPLEPPGPGEVTGSASYDFTTSPVPAPVPVPLPVIAPPPAAAPPPVPAPAPPSGPYTPPTTPVTPQPPKKSGCGLWGCIGCVTVVVFALIALLVIGYFSEKTSAKGPATKASPESRSTPTTEAILEGKANGVHVYKVESTKDKEGDHVVDELVSPGDFEVYIHFHWEDATPATVFHGHLYRDGVHDSDFDAKLGATDTKNGSGHFHFSWKGGFQPGQYLAKILVDDEFVCQIPFKVSGSRAAADDGGAPAVGGPVRLANESAPHPQAVGEWATTIFAEQALNQHWGRQLAAAEGAPAVLVGAAQDQAEMQAQVGWADGLLAVKQVGLRDVGHGVGMLYDAYSEAHADAPREPGSERARVVAAHIPGVAVDPAFVQVAANSPDFKQVALSYETAQFQGAIQLKWTGQKYEVIQVIATRARPKSGAWQDIPDAARAVQALPAYKAAQNAQAELLGRWHDSAFVRLTSPQADPGTVYVAARFAPTSMQWQRVSDTIQG